MRFIIGETIEGALNKPNYFTLHKDGSLLYSDKGASYSVILGDNWRYELLVDHMSGKCVGYSSLLYQMPIEIKSIPSLTSEKKSLYFIEAENSPLDQHSGCSYTPFINKAYFDKEKSVLCIGDIGAQGEHIEFADNIIATVEDSSLKCLYLKLENIKSSNILKFFNDTQHGFPLKKNNIKLGLICLLVVLIIIISILSFKPIQIGKTFHYDKNSSNIIYNNTEYFLSSYIYEYPFYFISDLEKLCSVIGIMGIYDYYTDDIENPKFILLQKGNYRDSIWFTENNFEYKNEVVLVGNTNQTITYSDCYIKDTKQSMNWKKRDHSIVTKVNLYFKYIPEMYIEINICKIDGDYYMGSDNIFEDYHKCSKSFLDILLSNGII